MQKYSDVVLDKNGKGVAGLTITVKTYPDGQPATIYGADGGPSVVSVNTDSSGRFSFYAASGHYSVTVSGTGITPVDYNDIVLFDPNDLAPYRAFANITDPQFAGGAKLDGTTDCAAARDAAINYLVSKGGGVLYTPPGSAFMSTMATIPDSAPIIIQGAGPSSKWLKGFNGDMVSLGKMSAIRQMWLEGNGATRTGRGIVISTGAVDMVSRRVIVDCDIVNQASYPVEYTAAVAGFYSVIDNCRLTSTVATVAGVKYPDSETNGNRVQTKCFTSGPVASLAGSQNTLVAYCDGAPPSMTSSTVKARIVANRFPYSSSVPTFTVDGVDTVAIGNEIGASSVVFAATLSKGTWRSNNDIGAGATITDQSKGDSVIDIARGGSTFYTPTWAASGGTPAVGNGSIGGAWSRTGQNAKVNVALNIGSTTSAVGTSWTFTLPYVAARNSTGQVFISQSTGGAKYYAGTAFVTSGSNVMQFVASGSTSLVGSAAPGAWVSGDYMIVDIDYVISAT